MDFRHLASGARFVAAAISILGAHASGSAGETAPACDARCTLVDIVIAKPGTFTPKVTLTGAIQPKFQTNIAFRISGKITQRLVETGDHVTAGQILAKLDPREQQASLDEAEASLASAKALFAQAQTGFERQDQLFKNGFTTRPNFDQAQQQVRTQKAAVDSAEAALGSAREQFGYTNLEAGVAGIITARNAESGQVVQAGQTVFTIAQDGPRDAVFDVYEALLTRPPASETVRVALQSDPTVTATGKVREISPTVDASSGTVRVKVALDSVPERMSLGAAVTGAGEFRPREAIVLPRGALFRWNNAPAVWILDLKTRVVEPKTVTIDRYNADMLVLTGGVEAGDAVVTAGIQFLHPGQIAGIASKTANP